MNIVESPVLPVPIKQKRFIFDKPLFLAKGIFFIVYGAAAMLTFLPLYFEQQGLSGQQIGLLAAIPPAIAVFGTSIWGALADGTQRHKQLFMLAIAGAMGSIIFHNTDCRDGMDCLFC
jgi:MFS family permease